MDVREKIIGLLTPSAQLLDAYFVDQRKYLESHSKTLGLGLGQDAKYFWIFRDLDYEKWVQRRDEARILGLHGPSAVDLELAASHIVRSLDAAGQDGDVLLYFFYNSTRCERDTEDVVGWRDLVLLWNLLRQLIKNRSTAEESLLQTFLKGALDFLGDDELAGLRDRGNPIDVFRSLLCFSKPQDLWETFSRVLGNLKKPENSEKQNLTLIIDLNSMTSNWRVLIDNIRQMTTSLMKAYETVRVLLSNVPEKSLGQRPSEILLEYDKEREGMYGLQIQSCPRH